ncbi:MAG: CBS domain-containing protein [Caldisericaceae bacterium]
MTKNTVILTHSGADFDAIASAFACTKLFPSSIAVHPGSTDINAQRFISLFEEVLNFKKVKDLPKAFIDDISRVVIVDTKYESRVGEGKEFLKLKNTQLIIIDHHPGESDIGNAIHITKSVGANTTILVNLLKLKKVKLTPIEATLLALGIYEDTGSLTFPSVTTEDFAALEFLFSFGVDIKIIHRFISPFLQEEQLQLLKELLDNLNKYDINGIRVGITSTNLQKYIPGISILAHKIVEMVDVDVIFVLVSIGNTVNIIGRSTSETLNLINIAETFKGGGHPTAVSSVIKNTSIDEIKDRILKELKTTISPSLRAKDFMSSPVKKIAPNATVKEALDTMIMYGFSGLPIEENEKIIGIVEKKNLEKAFLFGRKNREVKQFYSPKIVKVKKYASLREIEEKMIEEDVGRVLVEDGEEIIGIISRSDLLKAYKLEHSLREIPRTSSSLQLPKREFVIKMLSNAIPKNALKLIKEFGSIAKNLNIEIYLVGGSVRDAFLGKKIVDFDFVLSDAVSFGEVLKKTFNGNIRIFPDTQTVHFDYLGMNFDFVTSRREYYVNSSLVPIIEKASLKEDLTRRDFTINSMAIDIKENNFGQMFDYYGGYEDLLKKTIRVIKPLSFIEDPSRILRAIKYMIELDFKLSKETEVLLKRAVELGTLENTRSQRVQGELKELLEKDEIEKVLHFLTEYGILELIFRVKTLPKITVKTIKKFYKNNQDKNERLAVSIFFILLNKRNIVVEELSNILGVKKRVLEKMKEAIFTLKNFEKNFEKYDVFDVSITLNKLDLLYIKAFYCATKGIFRKFLEEYIDRLRFIKNELTGEDLKKLGLKENIQYRKIFATLTKLRMKGEINSKDDETNYILSHRGEFEWK